ncbi:hypothetical protein LSCM1_08149 [Leishmania martiniquensis]|uniref:Uncharacterized protein n=1 Tax=Leishmania martiniquensis TaxID=1580590 RepID=A0A836HPQ0_9TRYP|nr:hypothetical protein LSCM1_08149 [Leishmania martiniquensis]
MYFGQPESSHRQRPRHDNRHTQHHGAVDGTAPSGAMTLLPLRRRDRARNISAILTTPVVEYRPPRWTESLMKSPRALSRVPDLAAAAAPLDCSNDGYNSSTAHAYYTPLKSVAAFTTARTSSSTGGVAVPASKAEEVMLSSSSTATRQPCALFYTEASPPSAALRAQRDSEGAGKRVRGAVTGGAASVTAVRHSCGRSPPPHSASSARQSHRSGGIAEVRPGYTTSTERARYRNSVTKKLVDLYDEVAELHECRKNMAYQVTQAMRTDPRNCKESRGEVRLAYRPTPPQQSAVESVQDALEVLHGAMHELVAVYFTPEEKRYLGIDTHLFQASMEKANTYQYAPPPPKRPSSSSRGATLGARGKTSTAATSPSPSTQHSEVREERMKWAKKEATEGETHEHAVTTAPLGLPETTTPPGTSAPTPTYSESLPLQSLLPQPPPTNTALMNADSSNAGAWSEPAASAAINSARCSLLASPSTQERQFLAELAPPAASSESVPPLSPRLCSTMEQAAAPEGAEGVFGAVKEQQLIADTETAETQKGEGTPERARGPVESASTLGSAWPTDTAAGSPVHPPSRPRLSPEAQPLVKVPVRGRAEHILVAKVPPTVPPETELVTMKAQVPAPTSINLTSVPRPSQPPSHTASSVHHNGASAAARPPPQGPKKRSGFQQLLIESDSDQ